MILARAGSVVDSLRLVCFCLLGQWRSDSHCLLPTRFLPGSMDVLYDTLPGPPLEAHKVM